MRRSLFAVLVLCCTAAYAEVYRCPQTYPGKDGPPKPLTGAYMMWGELHGNGWVSPRDETTAEGFDLQYGLPEDEQSWLICQYGARKRVKGRFHDGHEWGQYMEGGGQNHWWMKLVPKVTECTVQVRERKSRDPGKSTWTVTATCK